MKEPIQILLNDEVHILQDINPNTTVLEYLRDRLGRKGSKEGCASGDCGACTVVMVGLEHNETAKIGSWGLRYKAINACITLLPSVYGKQLITVEDLKNEGQLHAVQQSMVDFNGSQCGFCTPGFVMSSFALSKNIDKLASNPKSIQENVSEALAGNLCRCTGYRSIVDAALASLVPRVDDQFEANTDKTIEKLKKINAINSNSRHCTPTAIDDLAQRLMLNPKVKIFAGGTDLGLLVTQQHQQFEDLIYVGAVKELRSLTETDEVISVGAALPYTEFFDLLKKAHPHFSAMIERLGSLQIRNQGTIGGNIGNASPIGDVPPVLIALNAKMTLRRGDNEREMAVEDYFIDYKVTALQPSEFIRSVHIPKALPNYVLKVYKISKRFDDDISAVLAALYLRIEDGKVSDVSIAFGGMAAIPKRAANCEAALLDKPWTQATIDAAKILLLRDFSPLNDMRASAAYRMLVAQNMLQRYFLESKGKGQAVTIHEYS